MPLGRWGAWTDESVWVFVYRYVRSDAVRRTQLRWVAGDFGLTVTVSLVQQVPAAREVLSVGSERVVSYWFLSPGRRQG